TTLVHRLMAANEDLQFSVSFTTRPQRSTEENGIDYHFVSPAAFAAMIEAGDFLEFANVFDHQYGTSKTQVEHLLNEGHNVILEIDWQGARQVRDHMPDCRTIFILPPSVQALKTRLTGRGTDSEAVIQRRFRDAVDDMSHWQEFDYVVVNEDLNRAGIELNAIISGKGTENEASGAAIAARVAAILDAA
ncbi:MAG: guanylate kinase, partial [Gammaproteobacteria bacterium]